MEKNTRRVVRIKRAVREREKVQTLSFSDSPCEKATPGQFVMCWIPRVDEIPLSLSKIGTNSEVTVKKVGEATAALCNKTEGHYIGIRGPYGNGFEITEGDSLIVAGGTGMCALRPLIYRLVEKGRVQLLIGGKTKNDLLFLEEMKKLLSKNGSQLSIATEDGSLGAKGLVTDLLEDRLKKDDFDTIYTCGPELMMKKVLKVAERYDVKLQASLERLIRCGIGLCGSCSIGPYRVCRDGPVFNSEKLRGLEEFGKIKRDFSGRKVRI